MIQQLIVLRVLETTTTGSDMLDTVNSYFQDNNLCWNCAMIWTDDDTVMAMQFIQFLTLWGGLFNVKHLLAFQAALGNYFPSISTSRVEWVMSLYSVCGEHSVNNTVGLASMERLTYQHICRHNIKTQVLWPSFGFILDLCNTWVPRDCVNKVNILLLFVTSYLCECVFSTLKTIKMKSRPRLIDTESKLCVCLSTIQWWIEKLCSVHQARITHWLGKS
jgi:hypothetical protein